MSVPLIAGIPVPVPKYLSPEKEPESVEKWLVLGPDTNNQHEPETFLGDQKARHCLKNDMVAFSFTGQFWDNLSIEKKNVGNIMKHGKQSTS